MQEKLHVVPKGWGFEKWIVNNEKYCGKLLYFIKDRKCSWHYHKIKDETFYIQSENFCYIMDGMKKRLFLPALFSKKEIIFIFQLG